MTLLGSYCKIAFSVLIIHYAKASFVGSSSWCYGLRGSGGREVVDDGFNGFLLHNANGEKLYEIMCKIINLNQTQLSLLGQNSREIAEKKFDERLVIHEYLSVLSYE